MSPTEYKNLTLADMKRRRWRTTANLETQLGVLPSGTEVRVYEKQGGLFIEQLAACPHCGVKMRVRKVNPVDIQEIRG